MSARQDGTSPPADPVNVDGVVQDVRERVRTDRRHRLLDRGAPSAFRDPEIFAAVEDVVRRAIQERGDGGLLVPDMLSDQEQWLLDTKPVAITSHRPLVGPLIVLLKRRVLLPMTRWLYQYVFENLQRQQRINRLLFACVEELAVENARLRREVERAGR